MRSSGNQAERGFRETARSVKYEFPRVNEVIQDDIYVDDCLSGEDSLEKVLGATDNLKLALNRVGGGGVQLKDSRLVVESHRPIYPVMVLL